jgi:hypothetical protein
MEHTSTLRQHLGESAHLVDIHSKTDRCAHLVDFTKTRPGEEITLIEVGEHGIIVEYVASGHKEVFAFDEIQIEERTPGNMRTHRNGYHSSSKTV